MTQKDKIIDEFAEELKKFCFKYPIRVDVKTNIPLYAHEDKTWHDLIKDVSEKLKGSE